MSKSVIIPNGWSESYTKVTLNPSGSVDVHRWQDAQDIADLAKHLADQPQFGADFHHRWSLPQTEVDNFFIKYNLGRAEPKPMDQEFWEWVNIQMKDPQYSKFWTHNPSNPFFTGYQPGGGTGG